MDATARMELKVGALVLAGMAAAVILILASERVRFERTYVVIAYLDNAGGLKPGSPVELAGIPIGSVASVRTTTDPRGPIVAQLHIQERYQLDRTARLALSTRGIFGDAYLSFSPGLEGSAPGDHLPMDGSAEMRVDPTFMERLTAQSEVIIEGLADLMQPEVRGHIKRIAAGGDALVTETRALVAAVRTDLDDLDALIADARATLAAVREEQLRLAAAGRTTLSGVDALVTRADTQLETSAPLFDAAVKELEALAHRLTSVSTGANELIAHLEKDRAMVMRQVLPAVTMTRRLLTGLGAGQGLLGQLLTSGALAQDFNHVLISIDDVSARIAERPEILIFGDSHERRLQARAAREARRVRRAFMEGFEYHRPAPETEPLDEVLDETGEAEAETEP